MQPVYRSKSQRARVMQVVVSKENLIQWRLCLGRTILSAPQPCNMISVTGAHSVPGPFGHGK